MKILVTGIDGFVGSHVAEFLGGIPDVDIYGTILTPTAGENLRRDIPNLRLMQVDLTNRGRVAEIFHDIRPDRVIHLAGQAFVPTAVQDPVGTIDTNIYGGVHVLEAARAVRDRNGVDAALLIVSSGEVYGAVEPERLPVTEDHALLPANPYAGSKAGLDLIAQTYRRTYGMRVVVARPFNHAGPRQSPSFVTSGFAQRFAEFSLGRKAPVLDVGNIHVRRDFTDVRDVARAYWSLLGLGPGTETVYNVCSGVAHEIVEVIAVLKELSGIDPKVVRNEQKVRAYDVPLLIGCNRRLRETTGWEPNIAFRDTLRDVYEYWKTMLAAESSR
jgi:GDP-4-dehydro-6-deoxy-D-mannose reductase